MLPRLLVWFPHLVCVLCAPPPTLAGARRLAPPALPKGPLPGLLGDGITTNILQYHAPQESTGTTSSSSSKSSGEASSTTTASYTSSSLTLAPASTRPPLNGRTSSVATGRATTSSSIYTLTPSSPPISQASAPMSTPHRDLTIILSVVLGAVGLLVIALAILLTCRRRRGKGPFGSRGASPINDEEIQSWRNTGHEPKHGHSSSDPRSIITRDVSIDSIALGHPPHWPPYTPHANMIHPNLPPSSLGRAPNARAGLTDETIPGDAPFVPAPKRQNSRLSKPPPGHVRTKSRRSSTSAKSTRSFNGPTRLVTWYDPDSGEMREFGDHISSSPGTSIWDGHSVGGLSPPPRSQRMFSEKEDEIGRAT